MGNLSTVADYGDLCGEGPVWDARARVLYWTDCVGRKVHRLDWPANRHQVIAHDLEVNSLCLDLSGGYIVSNNDGFWLWDGQSLPAPIANEVDGFRCQLNDSVADPVGRVLAGSCFYDPGKEYELGKLITLDTDGSLTIIDEGFHLINGLGFSPDGKTLYVTDSVARRIYAYDYRAASGMARNRRVLVQVPGDEGIPDGLAVDAEGFLWSAQWYGSGVASYDPDGKFYRKIHTPAKQTSSIAFGGEELTDMFITTAAKSETLPVMPRGYDPAAGFFGGPLYHINLGIQGKLEYKSAISVL